MTLAASNTFYVTTPIYYVNDRPHIGHVYTTIVADVLARYHRLLGDDVFFLTGVDEHAAKVVEAAEHRGVTAQQWADQNAAAFRDTFVRLGITNNDFVRTTEVRHKEFVRKYLAALLTTGDVYVGQYEGWYDTGQEEYLTDSKAQDYDFKSPINGKPLVRKIEHNYFFRLSAYRERLLRLVENGDAVEGRRFAVDPEARRNEIVARIREMEDVPISRSGQSGWGIPFPGDATQTVYVWIDALFNYLTYVDSDDRRGYWQSGATHLIAKDILWFHAAIWPALLLALRKCRGYEWVTLPVQVYSHSFWISEGQKMSKSLGNFIELEKLDHYVGTFGLDALRWFLATQGPLGTYDTDFSEAKFVETYNTDLANAIGNCTSRVAKMTGNYFGGALPVSVAHVAADGEHARDAEKAVTDYVARMERMDLSGAADVALGLVRAIDGYIERTAPFKLAKHPANLPEVSTILYNCAETLRIASLLLWPFAPTKTEELWRRLGSSHYVDAVANNGTGKLADWARWGRLQPGASIIAGEPLFPRYKPQNS
jgi:methionyl-tRNA synthetase